MISGRDVHYHADGLNMTSYTAQPSGQGPWPAVLLAHDGVGLDEYQRQRADLLAAQGYIAFALDYHRGEVFFNRPDAMLARVIPLLDDVDRMETIGRVALDLLLAIPGVDPNLILALGYGAGGRIMLELARSGFAFKAIALVHPALPEAKANDWKEVASAFLLCTGSDDPICTPQQLLTFGQALQEANADWRVTIYGGAEHAFWARPRKADGSLEEGRAHTMATVPGVGHHPMHARRAWDEVIHLFAETLLLRAKQPGNL